jgi:sec-independent protein translocase protein TatC
LSVGLFLAGAAVCQFLVLPLAVRYLLSWNESLGLEPDLRLNEWLTFAILVPLMFGITFQTPLVMLVLYKLGIVEVDMYTKHWRIAVFGMAVLSMLLLPTPDPFSMMAMTVPLWILYLFGIVLCKMSPRPKFEDDEPEGGDLVGV